MTSITEAINSYNSMRDKAISKNNYKYNPTFSAPVTIFNSLFVNSAVAKTNEFNEEYQKVLNYLTEKRTTRTTRDGGIQTAQEYEYAERKFGGEGTFYTTKDENQAILDGYLVNDDGSISKLDGSSAFDGYDGHHINNVYDHPDQKSNPDNIDFVTEKEHLNRHDGDFRNKTEGEMFDRDKRLEDINAERVGRNEIGKIAIAVGIAAGVAFSISFAIHLYQNGISMDTLKEGLAKGIRSGFETGTAAGITYTVSRFAVKPLTKLAELALTNVGVQISANIFYAIRIGTTGLITTAIMSIWQFVKLKRLGYSSRYAFKQVIRSASVSLALVGVICIVALYYGSQVAGPVGMIIGVLITAGTLVYTKVKISLDQETLKKIQVYTINSLKPNIAL